VSEAISLYRHTFFIFFIGRDYLKIAGGTGERLFAFEFLSYTFG